MERRDLSECVVEFLGAFGQFLFANLPGIDFLFQAKRVGSARDQFCWNDGFANVICRAGRVGRLNVLRSRMRRDDNDRQAL